MRKQYAKKATMEQKRTNSNIPTRIVNVNNNKPSGDLYKNLNNNKASHDIGAELLKIANLIV